MNYFFKASTNKSRTNTSCSYNVNFTLAPHVAHMTKWATLVCLNAMLFIGLFHQKILIGVHFGNVMGYFTNGDISVVLREWNCSHICLCSLLLRPYTRPSVCEWTQRPLSCFHLLLQVSTQLNCCFPAPICRVNTSISAKITYSPVPFIVQDTQPFQ